MKFEMRLKCGAKSDISLVRILRVKYRIHRGMAQNWCLKTLWFPGVSIK